jgi:hypothetical protein
MIKTIFKVLYISLSVVLAIVVFVFNYQSTTITQIRDSLNGFIKREEYYNVARMCGGLYDSNPIISIQNDEKFDNAYANKMEDVIDLYNTEINPHPETPKTINKSTIIEDNKFDMVVYAGTKDVTKTYYNHGDEDNLEKAKYHKYDFTYYIYLFDVSFSISDKSAKRNNGKKITVNDSGIRFYSGEESYDYYAVISDDYYHFVGLTDAGLPDYNTNYMSKPDNLQDMFISGGRNMFDSYDQWGFYDFSISRDSVYAVNKLLGGDDDNNVITSFAILDRDGKEVENSKTNFTFAFDEEFFADDNAGIIYKAYEEYNLVADNDDSSDSDISDAEDVFRDTAKVFDDNMKEGLYPTYFKAFDKSNIVNTSTVVWKSILVTVLFVFSATVVFILIFKFTWIKNLVFRKKEGHYVPNKEKARQQAQQHQQEQARKQAQQNHGQRLPRGKQNQTTKPVVIDTTETKVVAEDNNVIDAKSEEVKEVENIETPTEDVKEAEVIDTPVENTEDVQVVEENDNSQEENKE